MHNEHEAVYNVPVMGASQTQPKPSSFAFRLKIDRKGEETLRRERRRDSGSRW
jgi:hypothetical protein